MRKSMKTLAIAFSLVATLAAAPAIFAHDSRGSQAPKTAPGMIGPGMMEPGTMGQGGMMNMMNMMGQMSQMMEDCNKMMQGMTGGGSGRPNEQWRKEAPAEPK